MKYVGVDLHKKSITICWVSQDREVHKRKRLICADEAKIVEYFESLGEFSAVVEATASYEWFVRLLEPLAKRVVLAHPQKLRVIAESTRKSDKVDAQVLAEFLALDMIPQAYRPTPRQREHRNLVRHRCYLQRAITGVKNRLHRILSDYNSDRPDLFTAEGEKHLRSVKVSEVDRFRIKHLRSTLKGYQKQLVEADERLRKFAESAPAAEREAREVLRSIPGVGPVTTDVVVSELADANRFSSQKKAVAYAGLAPGFRESDGKRKELHIEKTGSRLLRWSLVEASWHLVRYTARWRNVFEQLSARTGRKKAIIAVARRLLCMMVAMWKSGQKYQHGKI